MFRGSSKLGLWGVIATIIYFLAIAYLIFFTDYVEPKTLTLNELGDFFAGVFGPPALIWVVISFYLQSEELKNSVSALKLQAEELAKSVEQQIAMVGLTRESISHEKSKFLSEEERRIENIRPKFTIELSPAAQPTMSSFEHCTMKIKNIGGPAKNTRLEFHGQWNSQNNSDFVRSWDRSDQHSFQVSYESGPIRSARPRIIISYQDFENRYGEQIFQVSFLGHCHEITSP